MNRENKTDRRKFFTLLGKSAYVISMFSVFPINLFAKKSKRKKIRKVNIHPNAVKRGQ